MERLTTDRDYEVDKGAYERHLAQGYPRNMARERFLRLCEYERTGHTPEEILEMQEELKRWHTNKINQNIRNEFAYTSTLCCHNCDHKDDYIEELEHELEAYKETNLTQEQFAELDKMYLAKCEEVNRLKAELAERE